jgi:toxin secretion/phage lysis holin
MSDNGLDEHLKWAEVILWLEANPMMKALMIIMVLDVIGGMLIAFARKELSSTVSYKGMAKKMGILMAIAIASLIQPFVQSLPILGITLLFYLASEALSVLEKLAVLKVPLPKQLVESLVRIKGEQPPLLKVGIVNMPPKEPREPL